MKTFSFSQVLNNRDWVVAASAIKQLPGLYVWHSGSDSGLLLVQKTDNRPFSPRERYGLNCIITGAILGSGGKIENVDIL